MFAMLPTDEKLMFRDELPNGFRLEMEKGHPTGRNILLIGTRIVLGRSPSCDVVVDDPTISEKHLELLFTPGRPVTLKDLNSTNGTFLNGDRVKQTALNEDDVIQIGHSHLRFKRNNG
jgi:pSer/pThr/pTyr-binding forkhead associated (FHA) protein